MSEIYEARFDGVVRYNGDQVTVRAWLRLDHPPEDGHLYLLRAKFDEVMENPNHASSLGQLSILVSRRLDNATVELTLKQKNYGTIGIVYYPEWP